VDEELQRSHWIEIVKHHVVKAVAEVENTEKELQMLEMVAQRPPAQQARDSRGNAITAIPTSVTSSKPIAYTILPGGRRQELASQVFQPGFNMATMTPEQAYEAEVRAGRMVKGGGNDKKAESDDEDEDDEDKLRKARYWDDFKDDNPFGSGNSKRS